MNKLAVLTTASYPSKLANRIHILNMVKSFSELLDTTFFVRAFDLDKTLPKTNVKKILAKKIYQSAFYIAKDIIKNNYSVWYCREPRLFVLVYLYTYLFIQKAKKPEIIFEIHDEPFSKIDFLFFKIIIKVVHKIVVITDGLEKYLLSIGASKDKIIVLPDAVDVSLFQKKGSLPKDFPAHRNFTVMYAGSLIRWKGVYTLLDVAKKSSDMQFVFIGGNSKDLEDAKQYAAGFENIFFLGYKEQGCLPAYFQHADLFVLPNSDVKKVSRLYTSPLKMFEYMASGKPIVASRIPSIQEILIDNQNALLFKSDDVDDLERKIRRIKDDVYFGNKLAKNAYDKVKDNTWYNRVKKILKEIKK